MHKLILSTFTLAFLMAVTGSLASATPIRTNDPMFNTFETKLRAQSANFEVRVLFDSRTQPPVSEIAPHLDKFAKIAKEQSANWDDTILEQNFEVSGGVEVDHIEGLFENGGLVAYKLKYSEKAAWQAAVGHPDIPGRIVETAYVSTTLTTWFSDPQGLASFQNQNQNEN